MITKSPNNIFRRLKVRIFSFDCSRVLVVSPNKRSYNRTPLNVKQRKEFITNLDPLLSDPSQLIKKKMAIEKVELGEDKAIYLSQGEPIAVQSNNFVFPHLKKIIQGLDLIMPIIVVDKGAIKFIVNGADVMRPGIVEILGKAKEGQLVLIVEETRKAPLAVGVALFEKDEILEKNKGKVIRTLHHLRDDFWNFAP